MLQFPRFVPRVKTFQEVLQEELERDPYAKALWEATRNAHDLDEFDAILDAFPEREEWERQQRENN